VDEAVVEVDIGAGEVVDKFDAVLSLVIVLCDMWRMPSGRLR